MLRIAKTSLGILDLSAVKDELGHPVILNGAAHRDVPDHEEHNPVLQRVRDAKWVTVTRVSVRATENQRHSVTTAPENIPTTDGTNLASTPENVPTTDATNLVENVESVPVPVPPWTTDGVPTEDPPQVIDDATSTDAQAKAEWPGKSSGKPDTRKTSRRP